MVLFNEIMFKADGMSVLECATKEFFKSFDVHRSNSPLS